MQVTLKVFQERETKTNEIFHQAVIFSHDELLIKNEIIKPFTETQTAISEELSLFKSKEQYEGNQTYLLTNQKQHQSSPPAPSQLQKSIHHYMHNECLQSPDKGICYNQKTEQIQNVLYVPKQKLKKIANSS